MTGLSTPLAVKKRGIATDEVDQSGGAVKVLKTDCIFDEGQDYRKHSVVYTI